eukprot:jgi/Botrbrau1/19772/Bobra.0124s0024.1
MLFSVSPLHRPTQHCNIGSWTERGPQSILSTSFGHAFVMHDALYVILCRGPKTLSLSALLLEHRAVLRNDQKKNIYINVLQGSSIPHDGFDNAVSTSSTAAAAAAAAASQTAAAAAAAAAGNSAAAAAAAQNAQRFANQAQQAGAGAATAAGAAAAAAAAGQGAAAAAAAAAGAGGGAAAAAAAGGAAAAAGFCGLVGFQNIAYQDSDHIFSAAAAGTAAAAASAAGAGGVSMLCHVIVLSLSSEFQG